MKRALFFTRTGAETFENVQIVVPPSVECLAYKTVAVVEDGVVEVIFHSIDHVLSVRVREAELKSVKP